MDQSARLRTERLKVRVLPRAPPLHCRKQPRESESRWSVFDSRWSDGGRVARSTGVSYAPDGSVRLRMPATKPASLSGSSSRFIRDRRWSDSNCRHCSRFVQWQDAGIWILLRTFDPCTGNHRRVAQSGQCARFGTGRSAVRVRPRRPCGVPPLVRRTVLQTVAGESDPLTPYHGRVAQLAEAAGLKPASCGGPNPPASTGRHVLVGHLRPIPTDARFDSGVADNGAQRSGWSEISDTDFELGPIPRRSTTRDEPAG